MQFSTHNIEIIKHPEFQPVLWTAIVNESLWMEGCGSLWVKVMKVFGWKVMKVFDESYESLWMKVMKVFG